MAYTPENNPYIPGDPYSYDLKWIVDKLKEAISLYQPLNDKFNNLYDFVHDYFDNLDLTAEVREVIDEMEADGFFDTLIGDIVRNSGTIEETVNTWLAENVTPVGSAVVVDASLSIPGAAADAEATGEAIFIHNGPLPLYIGTTQVNRLYNPNNLKRCTTKLFHITKPFTFKIKTGWQAVLLAGTETGTLTDYGWVIVGGGSYHYDLSAGEYVAIVLATSTLTDIDITTALDDSDLTLYIDDSNDDKLFNQISAINSALNASGVKPVYTVDVNGGGDFTSILQALKSTPDFSRIVVRAGDYDQRAEYEAYYGATYFTDYAGYTADIYSRGYFIGNGRELVCDAGTNIIFRYDGANSYVKTYFSVFNMGINALLTGPHIDYSELRYAIHDDYALTTPGTNKFENIIISGYPSNTAGLHWGGGMGINCTYILNNIIFDDSEMPANYGDFYYHNNDTGNANAANKVIVNNCLGARPALFIWQGISSKISYAIVNNCKFKSIVLRAYNAQQPYQNIRVIEFNNTLTG